MRAVTGGPEGRIRFTRMGWARYRGRRTTRPRTGVGSRRRCSTSPPPPSPATAASPLHRPADGDEQRAQANADPSPAPGLPAAQTIAAQMMTVTAKITTRAPMMMIGAAAQPRVGL
ncbi:hypothetical protein GCM10010357_42050 [Streptomyces luteireticuli]|uniref:Uncharacterized protein n=1 Tax=Streptomyces luteireticuli TaxID=173858 RepID=A0ABP3IQ71_9ACTN